MNKSFRNVLSFICACVIVISAICPFCPYIIIQAAETDKNTSDGISDNEIKGKIEVLINQPTEYMGEYTDGFRRKYPNVEVEYTYYADYENEVEKRMESGDYGDVFYIPTSLGSSEYDKYLEPLGKLQEMSLRYNFLQQSKIDGEIVYGIPCYAYLSGILYNKEVFGKAGISERPKSIEEFMGDMQLIKEHTDAIPFYTNYTADWAMQNWESFPYIEMTGDAGYRYNTFLYIEKPFKEGTPHYEVYRMLYDLISMGYCEPDITKSDWEASKVMLNNGQIGCIVIGSWAVSQFKVAGENGENVGFMPFPNSVNGKQYMTVSLDYSYGMAKNSQNKAAARAYIDYMVNESGYALGQDNLSTVRTDPYPDSFGTMENVVMINSYSPSDNTYNTYKQLSSEFEPGDTKEIKRIMAAAAGITDESFEQIINDWNIRWESSRTDDMKQDIQGNYYEDVIIFMDNSVVTVSESEKAYISEHPSLKVGYNRNLAPFSYETKGSFTGLALDMCEIISSNTGFDLEYYGYENTESLLHALENGEIDVAAAVEKQADGEYDIRYSKEYLSYMNVMVKRPNIQTVMLDGKRAAAVSGDMNNYWAGISDIRRYTTLGECIKSIQDNKSDYTITNYYSANYYTRDLECDNVDIVPSSDAGTMHLAFANNVDSTLVALCNKCVYSISEGSMQVSLLKYIEPPQKPVTVRRLIETNPVLCVVVVSIFFITVLIFVLIIMRQRIRESRRQKMEEVKSYQEKAETDPLTKVYNRNGFDAHTPKTAGSVMFAILDMDNFKAVNDTLGHSGGDYALTILARAIQKCMGDNALVGRYGGDEFMLILSGISLKEAEEKLQNLVDAMDCNIYYKGSSHKLSISVGAVYSETEVETAELFAMADGVLYVTKANGKNGYNIEMWKDSNKIKGE